MVFYEELKQEPIFMGFKITADSKGDRNNDKKQPVGVDNKPGVPYESLDSRLGTYEQAQALNMPYIGLSLMRPIIVDGYQIVCIDGDWKRAKPAEPKPEQTKLLDYLSRMGAAYEKSYSGYGYHFFIKVLADKPIPKTVDLGDDCKIEVFSGNQHQRANILLTDEEAFGNLIEVDLMAVFEELGIQTVSASMDLRPVESDKAFDQEITKAMFSESDYDILASAMAALPVPKDYHEWYTVVGLALKSVKGAAGGIYDAQLFDLWDDYSQRDPKYNSRATLEKWNLPEKNIRSTLGTIYYLATENGWIRPRPLVTPQLTDYIRDKKGHIELSQQNVLLFMKRFQLRYDEFRASYMGVFNNQIENLVDEHITQIQHEAEVEGFKRLPTAFVRENALYTARNNSFDSAIEWGNSLVWDGTPRCDRLLVHYFGAADTDYIRAASMYIASAMGGRLMEPGCKADAAVVLIGKQGAGKSTAISALAPMDETFVEINLSSRDSDLSRQLRGKLIGEIAELRGLQSRESEDIKAFMSRTFENWVPKFKEFETTFKRRITFWGTSNEKEFLSDHTGNRRWLPIEVNNPDADKVKADRDQIWAEAIHIYRTKGICWQEVQELVKKIHEEHIFLDPLRTEIEDWLHKKDPLIPITVKNFHASRQNWMMEITYKEARAIGRAFTSLGYTGKNQRIDGAVHKVYTKDE